MPCSLRLRSHAGSGIARKNAARPCAESDGPEIWRHDGKERPRTTLLSAQTAPPGRGWLAHRRSGVLRICCKIFTKPNGSLIVAAVVFKFRPSLLQKFVCTLAAAPLLCVAAEDATP